MKILDFLKNLLNSLLDGSFERTRIVTSMNEAFKVYYYSGELERFCKVSISSGCSEYRHEMSAFVFRSGFKISIENDANIKESELRDISQYILSNTPFVRQLMSLGFDTLIIIGKTTSKSLMYSLKQYTSLSNFFIE